MKIAEHLEQYGVVPVIKLDNPELAVPLGNALSKGGLPIAEITFRADGASDVIRNMSESVPEMLIGAGTVVTINQVDEALAAGAQFIVAPGFNPEIVGYCVEKNIPVFPGINSPSQIESGLAQGLDVLKFFPAETSGGIAALKAMSAAYGNVRFMPTGGISSQNIGEYMRNEKVLACGGSWMVKADLIESGNFEEISILAGNAVLAAISFEFAHVGVNSQDDHEARVFSERFSSMFGVTSREGNSSYFIGEDEIEVVKSSGFGKNGHLALKVNRLSLAKSYLERNGVQFNDELTKYKNGREVALFLADEMNGFGVHLLQR